MATHDYVIDNQSASAFRSDLNGVLQAIVTQNSSATAPATTYADMIWYDSANNQLKKRNEANSGWITLGTVDESTGRFTPTGSSDTGAITFFATSSAPAGWLKANGALVSRTTYAALFSVIGTTFGVGDGSTTFALPDLRGEFPRGWDDGRGVDSARVFGSAQTDAFQGHWHGIENSVYGQAGNDGGGGSGAGNIRIDGSPATPYPYATYVTTDGVNGTPRTAAETRPRNIALLACIKF
jgi:phage-related tail fiber protein